MSKSLQLDTRALDRARLSRDARFDGKFFIGVTSTGIYCRPICPSRTSKPANVRYYATAAAAAEAGFRPCLRCRPEAAPGTPAWLGTSAVVRRALRIIQEGGLDEFTIDELATRLGVSSRHLHRLFMRHVGASPITVAQTRRLHFAKRLLDETDLPITQIALASGFGSVRRFNDSFRRTYQRAPRELRKQRRSGKVASNANEVVLRLAYRPPYDWTHVEEVFSDAVVRGVERMDEQGYARTVATDSGHGLVFVRPITADDALELRVRGADPSMLIHIVTAARRMFDLAADCQTISATLGSDALLGSLLRQRPGLRIPGAWDPFECTVRTLLAENNGAAVAKRSVDLLVERAGQRIDSDCGDLTRLFPTPATLATADLDALGIASGTIGAIRSLARAVVEQKWIFLPVQRWSRRASLQSPEYRTGLRR